MARGPHCSWLTEYGHKFRLNIDQRHLHVNRRIETWVKLSITLHVLRINSLHPCKTACCRVQLLKYVELDVLLTPVLRVRSENLFAIVKFTKYSSCLASKDITEELAKSGALSSAIFALANSCPLPHVRSGINRMMGRQQLFYFGTGRMPYQHIRFNILEVCDPQNQKFLFYQDSELWAWKENFFLFPWTQIGKTRVFSQLFRLILVILISSVTLAVDPNFQPTKLWFRHPRIFWYLFPKTNFWFLLIEDMSA